MEKLDPFYYLFLVCFVFIGYNSQAQFKENTEYNIWSLRPGDTVRIYGRMANIRTGPGTTAPIQDSLTIGTKVIIKELDTVLENIREIYAPWAKVSYTSGNRLQEGYVWLGMMALGSFEKKRTTFVYGIEKLQVAKDSLGEDFVPAVWYIHIKAINDLGTILDEKEVKMDGVGTTAHGGKLLGDMGLEHTEDIVRIYFGGEACGIPTYYFYFGWTGNKLIPLPGKMEVGDAGVFYHTETFLFPKEPGGQKDKIIRLTEEGESDEEKLDKDGQPIFKVKKSREAYKWDGTKAIKI